MLCTKCGNQIPEGSNFCESCGTPISAQASYDNSQRAIPPTPKKEKKRGFKKRYIAIIAAVVIVIIIAVSGSSENAINTVKDGKFDNYKEKTIGEAFDKFFGKPKWTTYEKNGDTYVEFTGGCTLAGEKADAEIIFFVNDNRFNIESCKVGNYSADNVEDMTDLLDTIYEK